MPLQPLIKLAAKRAISGVKEVSQRTVLLAVADNNSKQRKLKTIFYLIKNRC
jgi:hypothetical protein